MQRKKPRAAAHLQRQAPEPRRELRKVHLVAPALLERGPDHLGLEEEERLPSGGARGSVERAFDGHDDLLEAQLEVDGELEALDKVDVARVGAERGELGESGGEGFDSGDEGRRDGVVLKGRRR